MRAGDLNTAPTSASRATRATVRGPGPGNEIAPVPVVLDRYRLVRRLGSGAFGSVWMAHDERLERNVAVKILARERVVGGRFEREARAAARLSHPAIVTLYEAAVDDHGAYLVSELVLGRTLDQLLRDGRLSDRDVVEIGIVLCDALAHAHSKGVVHRDVKPSNVLVPDAPASDAQLAKLTDFGVARVAGGEALTLTGDVVGTLAYMAPEQAAGHDAGPAADLFALALVLYEALSGVNPMADGATHPRARRPPAHLPSLRRQRRELPAELCAGIDQALAPRPSDRGSPADLRAALAASSELVGDEPGVVAPGGWMSRLTGGHSRAHGQPYDELDLDELEALDGPKEFDVGRRDRVSDWPDDARHGADWDRAAGERERWEPEDWAQDELDRDAERPLTPWQAASDQLIELPPWADRAAAATAATLLTAWLSERLVTPAPAPPALAALMAGCATLLAPRLGWAAVTLALALTALFGHHGGAALVIVLALLIPVVLMPGRPTAWPLAAAAPALGMIGLAGAWPALAARAGTTWRRAALGATGWLWLLGASALTDAVLYVRLPSAVPSAATWTRSAGAATNHVLAPLGASGVIAPALVWAAGAMALPWLVRGRSAALDVIRVVIWAAMLTSATTAAIVAVHGSDALGGAPTAVVGAVASVVVALGPRALGAWREALRPAGPQARVP